MKFVNGTKEGQLFGQQNSVLNIICTVNSGQPQSTLELKLRNISIMSNYSDSIKHSFIPRRHDHLKRVMCIADNSFHRLAMNIQLHIYLSPLVHVYAEPSAEADEGTNITLVCRYESNVNENVLRWKRNNSIFLNAQNRNLTLTNVSKDDTGNYYCVVENKIGIGTDMIKVTVFYKPRVIEDSSTLEVESKIGKPSFIFLAIVSKTKPFISWTFYPGGKKGNWNVQDLEEEIYNVSSTIVPYDTSHLGWYGARVRNDIGSLDLNIELIGFKVYVFPSKMVYNTSNVIELTCHVSHQNVSNFSNTWVHFYGGIEIRTLQGKVENSLSKLQIPFCDYRDTGTYTCRWSSSSETHSSSSEIYVRSHPVLTALRTSQRFGKTELEVCFYSFPIPIEALWFYKDKTISQTRLIVGINVQETEVMLLVNKKRVMVNGFITSHLIDGLMSTDIELYSCQVRNIMGNLDVSFLNINNSRNLTRSNEKDDRNNNWLIFCLIGSFSTILIVTLSFLYFRYSKRNCRGSSGRIDIRREQEVGSRNSSRSSSHSYAEVDSVYYHTVEWRNYTTEAPITANIDASGNADVSIGSRESDKTGDGTDQTQNEEATQSYMELV
ncbi:MAM domain-containing glycosylphosphatidylinositol anchor protein 2-like [Mytilus edulis]|uniref:MAM domain-containing glycosylphosphatidylinositol anchor protein 2-like n=1 Tax=Mytilus edulis TaxID=6550 RepID=UPI0039EEFAB4